MSTAREISRADGTTTRRHDRVDIDSHSGGIGRNDGFRRRRSTGAEIRTGAQPGQAAKASAITTSSPSWAVEEWASSTRPKISDWVGSLP